MTSWMGTLVSWQVPKSLGGVEKAKRLFAARLCQTVQCVLGHASKAFSNGALVGSPGSAGDIGTWVLVSIGFKCGKSGTSVS